MGKHKNIAKRFLNKRTPKFEKSDYPRHFSLDDEKVHPKELANPRKYRNLREDAMRHVGTDFSFMQRWLTSQIGKPWDDVYSEICQLADRRQFQGRHFHYWLNNQVDQYCTLGKDGQIYNKYGVTFHSFWTKFYVHPVKRTLEIYKVENQKYRREVIKKIFELEDTLFHCHDGIWYRVQMKELPPYNRDNCIYIVDAFHTTDTFQQEYRHRDNLYQKFGLSPNKAHWYCEKKEQANHKEIMKLKAKYFSET